MKETEEIKKIAIYTRVSTDEQARSGLSLENQLERLRTYCKAKEWDVVGEYVDPGYTGRNIRRPQYQKMFEDTNQWDGVLVLKMDRIHRNVMNCLKMMEDLNKKEKEFVSFSENIDTSTAMGRAMMNITLVFAQLESEQIGERVSAAMFQKAKQKEKFMGHRVPFGYRWDPKKHKFLPIGEELEIVKQVFQMYLDGYTMRQIGRKVGKANTTVKYYLHNCFYAGIERWCNEFRKIPNLDPVISVDAFNIIQKLLRERCHSHRNYDPMLIKDADFKLDFKKVKVIPVINRAKHNYNY